MAEDKQELIAQMREIAASKGLEDIVEFLDNLEPEETETVAKS